ncbi:hypothetical protein B0H10DRAFT_2437162 [Mycena sp. CBHHK59/15]|nr:hypothetical protein B0H10DRAFT_2437162 [Mycena sp. CBHHK59/15]
MPPSVDYATDELIGKTINQCAPPPLNPTLCALISSHLGLREFADSTILTIAHRIRSVVTYDRIMLLDQGRIAEFDRPAALLADPASKFHALCKAAGADEFAMLKKLAGSSGFAVRVPVPVKTASGGAKYDVRSLNAKARAALAAAARHQEMRERITAFTPEGRARYERLRR